VSTRAHKHCRELTQLKQSTKARAIMLYLVQHTGIESVSPATHIDPKYTEYVKMAKEVGVEFIAYNCIINEENIHINQPLIFTA
jgi:sugar fermentation stimulation protein A